MKLTQKLAVLSLVSFGSLCAAPAFNFSNQSTAYSTQGGSLTYTSGAITLSAYAWNTTDATGSASGNKLLAGYVDNYNAYGMGVCASSEGQYCSSPQHQIDNSGRYEFILFTFSTPVDLASITLQNFGTDASKVDMDMSYWTGSASAAAITAGTSITGLGSGWSSRTDVGYTACSSCNSPSVTDTLSGNNVKYLLVGAAYAGDSTSDFFKIVSLDATVSKTPEPATFALIGFGLFGVGVMAKRRKAE